MRTGSRSWVLVVLGLWAGVVGAQPLVGPSVGNADLLMAEGSRLYNTRQYEEAAESFLKATRVRPETLGAYLGLARARFGARSPGFQGPRAVTATSTSRTPIAPRVR